MTERTQLMEWADKAAEELVAVYGTQLPACAVKLSIAGAPGGDTDLTFEVEPGSASVVGELNGEPQVTVTMKYKDFVSVLSGELPPPVAYMQGRLKPAGEMPLILGGLARTVDEDFGRWRQRSIAGAEDL